VVVAGTARFTTTATHASLARTPTHPKESPVARSAAFALGLDLGTNSARALIVDVRDGREIAQAVANFPSGKQGIITDARDPNLARQHPADYAKASAKAIKGALQAAAQKRGFAADRIIGIGVDTTGSTPIPVDADCKPLTDQPKFKNNPDAMAWLWKDHTSAAEAEEITALAREQLPENLEACGGVYSSEWFWSKILNCRRRSPKVFEAAHSWLEQCDYVVAMLAGVERPADVRRSVCAAGHKALYLPGPGLPPRTFLEQLDPALADLRDRLYEDTYTSDTVGGELSGTWARKLGLPAGIPIAVGAIDAHLGAVGAGIRPGTLVKILGTSVCDMLTMPSDQPRPQIPGLCGVVDGSIVPGCFGLEAGQPAVGDIFNWWVANFDGRNNAHAALTKEAQQLKPGESGLLALDWNNGNRSVLVDVRLTGLLLGQTLHTTAAEVYRALIEATAFGARMIMERMEQIGASVTSVVNCGGIAEKNPLLMQIYADVTGRPMKLSRSDQTCALGAAVCGAVVGGAYPSITQAQKAMTGLQDKVFKPAKRAQSVYDELYTLYHQLHDAFGGIKPGTDVGDVMKRLIALRDRVRRG
jgi:L-ribulokinase